MNNSERGFTLIEVVLAIAVGLIIIAGVTVGYTYAKRAAILDNQRKNVGAIKTFVEQAITTIQADAASGQGTLVPPPITNNQLGALADRLPSFKFDPYSGATRVVCGTREGDNSCYGAGGAQTQDVTAASPWGPSASTIPGAPSWATAKGSAVGFVPGDTFKRLFTIVLADGSTRTFYGYVILETDEDGNIVAADGGDTTTQQIGPPTPPPPPPPAVM